MNDPITSRQVRSSADGQPGRGRITGNEPCAAKPRHRTFLAVESDEQAQITVNTLEQLRFELMGQARHAPAIIIAGKRQRPTMKYLDVFEAILRRMEGFDLHCQLSDEDLLKSARGVGRTFGRATLFAAKRYWNELGWLKIDRGKGRSVTDYHVTAPGIIHIPTAEAGPAPESKISDCGPQSKILDSINTSAPQGRAPESAPQSARYERAPEEADTLSKSVVAPVVAGDGVEEKLAERLVGLKIDREQASEWAKHPNTKQFIDDIEKTLGAKSARGEPFDGGLAIYYIRHPEHLPANRRPKMTNRKEKYDGNDYPNATNVPSASNTPGPAARPSLRRLLYGG